MHTVQHEKTGVYETIFDNGLKLLTLNRSRLPIVTTMIWYRIGSCHCMAGDTGIAHLIEHLMFKGTSKLKPGEIDTITQELGGSNNAFTSSDYTCYFFNFPVNAWETALKIEADRMVNCRWDPIEFDREKNVVLEEMASCLDSPIESVTQEAETLCYQRHPYRYPILGWREDLSRLTLQKVSSYYDDYYAPNNAVLVIVGDVKVKQAIAKVKRFFGKIPSGRIMPNTDIEEPRPLGQKRISIPQEVNVARFALLFPSCRGGSHDDYVLDLIDIVLSCGRSSRLFRKFVLEEDLVHSIGSYNNSRKHQGIFWIHGELTPGVGRQAMEQVITEELQKLSKRPVGRYELEKAKNIYLSNFIFDQESNYDMANKVGKYEIIDSQNGLENSLNTVKSITARDIQKIAGKYLAMEMATVAWSFPKNGKNSSQKQKSQHPKKVSLRGVRIPKISCDLSFRYNKNSAAIIKNGQLPVKRYRLDNGLTLLVLKNSVLPCISLELRCNRLFDTKGREGTGYLVGRLLHEGTHRHSGRQLANTVDYLGADFCTYPSGICAKFLNRDLDSIMEVLADIMLGPLFDTSTLNREKQKLQTYLLGQQDNPFYLGKLAFRNIVYGDHPYGSAFQGTPQSINKINRKDLVDYFKRRFIPNRSTLIVVGDVEPDNIYQKAKQTFHAWKPGKPRLARLPKLSLADKPVARHISMDKQQLVVYWGHLGVDRKNPDYYKLRVLDQILGEGVGFTDRLSKKIRDELGLCYSIEACTTTYAGSLPGIVGAFFSTTPGNYKKALDVLVGEIEKIKKIRVPDAELQRVKKFMTSSFLFALEENDALVSLLFRIQNFKLGFDYIDKFIKTVDGITSEDIVQVAQKYLHPEIAATVVVGPVNDIVV